MKSYPDSYHMWTAEGIAVIYDEENEYEDVNQAFRVKCENAGPENSRWC